MALVEKPLGSCLVRAGLLTPSELEATLKHQGETGGRIGSTAVELGFVSEIAAVRELGRQLGVPGVALGGLRLETIDFSVLNRRIAAQYRVLPYRMFRKTCVVAMANPLNRLTISQIEDLIGRRVRGVVVLSTILGRFLDQLQASEEAPADVLDIAVHGVTDLPEEAPSGTTDEADQRQWKRTRAENTKSARTHLREALLSLRDGRWDKAVDQLAESIRKDPFDPRTHRYLARAHAHGAEWKEASEAFRCALSLDGQHFETWCGLAAVLEHSEGPAGAVQCWRSALERAPDTASRERVSKHILALGDGKSRRLPDEPAH